MSAPATLDRLVFKTSRLSEFCSERELINQTGHDSGRLAIRHSKELVDNALDACEEAGFAPVIEIEVSDAGITISDNGPGIAPERSRPSSTITLASQAARLMFRRPAALKAMR